MADLISIQSQAMLRQGAVTAPGTGAGVAAAPVGEVPLVSVIVPAYNEEVVLGANLARLHTHLSGQHERYRFELIVVDDGSRDRTGAIADTFAASHPHVRVLHHRVNGNLGAALRTGFRHSRGDVVVTLDCDLTYDPAYVDRLLDALDEQHAHVALASAYLDGGEVSGVPWLRLLLSRSANRYLSTAVYGELATLTCMVRAYRGDLIRSLPLRANGTDINTEIIHKARMTGARLVEIPAHLDWATATKEAPGRVSSAKLARSVSSYLRAGLLLRPSALLVPTAVASFVLSALAVIGFGIIAVRDGLGHALIDQLALVVVGTGSALGGTVLVATAFVARLLKHYFEELFGLTTARSWGAHDGVAWEDSSEQQAGDEGSDPGRAAVRSFGPR
ncbi:MAG: glycosyltransferase family 2 protein [Acidimicrobiales bacterium]